MKKWHGNPWAILLTLSLGFFMTLLDLTIVNIAIPNMIDELGRLARRGPVGRQRLRSDPRGAADHRRPAR